MRLLWTLITLICMQLSLAGTWTFHSLEVYDGCSPKPQAYALGEGSRLIFGVTDELWAPPGTTYATRIHAVTTTATWKWTWTPASAQEDPLPSVEVVVLNSKKWDTLTSCGTDWGIPGNYLSEVLIPALFVTNTTTSTRWPHSTPNSSPTIEWQNKAVAYFSESNGVYTYTMTVHVASSGSSIRLISQPNYGYAMPPAYGKCTWDVQMKPIEIGGQSLP